MDAPQQRRALYERERRLRQNQGRRRILHYGKGSYPVPFKEDEYELVSVKKGKDYEYTKYKPLFDYVKDTSKGWFVTNADYVTLTDGTGVVHIAPAFGEDDAQVGRRYDLPL